MILDGNGYDKVIPEGEVADDGEEVDQDESKNGSQEDGAPVTGDGPHHVEQGLFLIEHIKHLTAE